MSGNQQETLTPEEFLEHFGVKGMKWGVRKNRVSNTDIKDARIRVNSEGRRLQNQADRVNLAAPGSAAQRREAKKFAEMDAAFMKNPDRATALRITRGEKIAFGILAVGIPGAGTAGAAGAVAGRVAIRKVVERQVRKANS